MSSGVDATISATSSAFRMLGPLASRRHATGHGLTVALITEGTYPFTRGGVSTWCDQLMTRLSEVTFEVVSIAANGGNRPVWTLPSNAVGLTQLGFWEPHAPGERARYLRAMGRGRVDPRALATVVELLELLTSPEPDFRSFSACLDELVDHAGEQRLAPALRCRAAVEALTGLLSPGESPTSMSEVVRCLDILEHLLRPAGFDLPPADIYHATGNGLSALVAMTGSRRTGAPILMSEHGVYLRERYLEYLDSSMGPATSAILLRFHRLLTTTAYRRADLIVPVTGYNRRWELRNGADDSQIRVVNNGVDPNHFGIKRPRRPANRRPTVGFLSRIDRLKDPLTLIHAAALARTHVPDLVVRLWGSVARSQEDYEHECREAVRSLGLEETVSFEGVTDDPRSAYHSIDVLVSASISEGLPYGIIEAMMCRTPIISTNVGGLPEALEGAGLLIEPRDPEAMARSMMMLLTNPAKARRLGAAAHRRAFMKFTLDEMTNKYRGIYHDVSSTIDLRSWPAESTPSLETAGRR